MINKYLIVCTFRSGSTILATLMQEATQLEDLGEYVFNGASNDQSLMKYTCSPHSRDLLNYERARRERIQYLMNRGNWIARNPVVPGGTNKELIDLCANRIDTQLIFLYRRNIFNQYLSSLNTTYRSRLNRAPENRFYNNKAYRKFDTIDLPEDDLKQLAFATLQKIDTWRFLYEQYKTRCKLVCYEDHIETLKLDHVGITKDVIDRYYGKDKHLIKTPYICTNFKHDNIQNYVDFFESYKYITDL
jgi:LPS sulfotransferase NodH